MATINGDGTGETLQGTNGEDNIVNGNGGDDSIRGAGTVIDGASDGFVDTLDGGAGNDTVQGYYGDRLLGGAGNDALSVDPAGNDSDGPFFMDGGTGADFMSWNFLGPNAALGSIVMVDDPGDRVFPSAPGSGAEVRSTISADLKTLGDANPESFDADYIDHLTLLGSADLDVTGNAADNILKGNTGDNEILSEEGDDTLEGGTGNDTLDGGADTDTGIVGVSRAQATVMFDGQDVIIESSQGTDRYEDIENFQFTDQTIARGSLTEDLLNTAPVAVNDTANTGFETSVLIDVLANDSDADGDPLTIDGIAFPASNGSTAIESGQIRYTPNGGFSGVDTFTYGIDDGMGGLDTATVMVTVAGPVNTPPMAVNDTANALTNGLIFIDVLANDSDADGDPLTISNVTNPANGTANVVAGQIQYTSDPLFVGNDIFQYTIDDGMGGMDTATINVTVAGPGNNPPMAVNDAANATTNTLIFIDVLSNDSDADGDPLTISNVTNPANGTANVVAGQIQYTSDPLFVGNDIFQYTIDDGMGGMDTATINVTVTGVVVNTPPVAVDDTVNALPTQFNFIDVLANDSDADGDPLTIVSTTSPSNGSTAIIGGEVRYAPDPGFMGFDTFDYTIDDGNGGMDTATVNLTVGNAPMPLPVGRDFFVPGEQDVDQYNFDLGTRYSADFGGFQINITPVDPEFGSATLVGDTIQWNVAAGYNGPVVVDYTFGNGIDTEIGRVGFLGWDTSEDTVSNVDVEVDENTGFAAGFGLAFNFSDEKDRFNDPDRDPPNLTVNGMNADQLFDMSAADFIDAAASPFGLTFDLALDGQTNFFIDLDEDLDSLDATPDDTSSFLFRVRDPGGDSAIGVFSIENGTDLTPNAMPVANADMATTTQNVAVEIDVIANDTDADGDALMVDFIPTDPENGTATVVNNRIMYTPNQGFTGTDSLVYALKDGNGGLAVGEVDIQVNAPGGGDNTPPNAVNDVFTVPNSFPSFLDVRANDTDAEQAALTISAVSSALNGTTSTDGSFVIYTPNVGFTGQEVLSYTVIDGQGGSDQAFATVTVVGNQGGNTPPDAANDIIDINRFTPITYDPTTNDGDLDGDPITVIGLLDQPAGGRAFFNEDGTLSYAPRPDFTGFDGFNYTISDGNGGTDSAFADILVLNTSERIVCAHTIAYMYEAAFNRFPDTPGVNFWIDAFNFELPGQTQVFTKRDIAEFFLTVPEFVNLYGPVDQLTDAELIEQLFLNTLDRPGDAAGVAFWEGVLADPNFTRADMLIAFATSPENQLGSPNIITLTETSPSEWEFI